MPLITRARRGQGVVEFAIITPVIVFLMISFVQLGLVLSSYVSVTNVAREAARAAIVHNLTEAQRQAAADNAVFNGDVTTGKPTGFALGTGFIPAGSVTLTYTPGPGDPVVHPRHQGDELTVTVPWTVTMDIGVFFPTPDFTVNARSTMRVE